MRRDAIRTYAIAGSAIRDALSRLILPVLLCAVWCGAAPKPQARVEKAKANAEKDCRALIYEPSCLTSREIRDVWLRFHEADLCQDLDAAFVFLPKGMEVWCQGEDEKSYQKFTEMVEPLQPSFEIAVYATRPPPQKKQPEDRDPPASLWQNSELRAFLQDPFGRNLYFETANTRPPEAGGTGHNSFLRQRLLMYAEQVLDWNKKMRRYGADLPEIARLGFSKDAEPDMKRRAAAVCLAHVQALDRHAGRLTESLAQALPKPTKRSESAAKPQKFRSGASALEIASQLSATSQGIARRIDQFIRHQQPTVELQDLREPDLLESLRALRAAAADFQHAARSGR